MNESTNEGRCRVCSAPVRELFRSSLGRAVSSSCAVVRGPARVVVCTQCGLAQKTDTDLVTDYVHYELFDNDPAADKIIRRPGQPDRTRAQFVADLVADELGATQQARVLEVGCHRGAFLAALRSRAPSFELHGYDLNPDYARFIEPICGPGRYHHGSLADLKGALDACVLIHTLEHIPAPLEALRVLRRLVREDGRIVVVVPDIQANPADCYTADHTCHFDRSTLEAALALAGFAGPIDASAIGNELVATCRPATALLRLSQRPPPPDLSPLAAFERGIERLPRRKVHVFGTALLGALIAGHLGDDCVGFADEAPFRAGKMFHGKPVRQPRDLAGQTVVLGVAENLARALTPRLNTLGLEVIDPWALGRSAA